MKIDPMIIPKFGCASFNNRGGICKGTEKLNKDEWCNKCLCFNSEDLIEKTQLEKSR